MTLRSYVLGMAAFSAAICSADAAIYLITSDITTNTTWTTGNTYVLQGSAADNGVISVRNGATLTIEGGVIVRGQPRTDAATYDAASLAALAGEGSGAAFNSSLRGRIVVRGTATSPVIFTTAAVGAGAAPDGYFRNGAPGSGATAYVLATRATFAPDAGTPDPLDQVLTNGPFWDAAPVTAPHDNTYTALWGGLVVLGTAPVNAALDTDSLAIPVVDAPTAQYYGYTRPVFEGVLPDKFSYGGGDAWDNSGSYEFISIRHGGVQLASDKEINGLSLCGVGAGTKVANIEVWGNEDDGVEIFGGTVFLKNILIVGTKDDGFDIDQGWSGGAQFVCVIGGSNADKLGEWDGDDRHESDARGVKDNYEPRASASIYNGTFIGGPTANIDPSAGVLVIIRNNANYRLYNSLLSGFVAGPLNVTNKYNLRGTSALNYVFRNVVSYLGASGATNSTGANAITTGIGNAVSVANPSIFVTYGAGEDSGLMTPVSSVVVPSGLAASLSATEQGVPPLFFTSVGYRGAFATGGAAKWTDGWTAADKKGAL